MREPAGRSVYDGSTFREFIPNPKAAGTPWVHLLGATHGPAFTVRRLLPPWEPPLPRFGTWVTPVRPLPAGNKKQEIPEAFRRR